MKFKFDGRKSLLAVFAVFASVLASQLASAQTITGSLAVGTLGSGSYTSNSLTLANADFVEGSPLGDFSGVIPQASEVVEDTAAVSTGTYSSPIDNYLLLSSPFTELSSSGTTPTDRFSFDLTSLSEVGSVDPTFYGTGILVDNATTDAYEPTDASFTLGFSGASNYSFTLAAEGVAATPEPSSWMLGFIGLTGFALLVSVRRRMVA